MLSCVRTLAPRLVASGRALEATASTMSPCMLLSGGEMVKSDAPRRSLAPKPGARNTSFHPGRRTRSWSVRSFSNIIAGDLGQIKEDPAASAVVRKLVVDGNLPPKSVSYVPATIGRSFEATKQPVAVLIGFLESTPRYLKRHVEIYNERGIDALVVCPTYQNVLWPSTGRKLAQTMIDALDMEGFAERPLVIHGFSTGGYMYGNMLLFSKEQSGPSSLRSRVVGQELSAGSPGEHPEKERSQVMDSAVDMNGIPHGVPQVVAYQLRGDPYSLPVMRAGIEQLIHLYLWATHSYTTVPYTESSDALHNNTLQPPSLFVYSKADMLARVEDNEAVASKWKARGGEVQRLVFDNSGHCQHLRKNPEMYKAAMHALLDKVQLILRRRAGDAAPPSP